MLVGVLLGLLFSGLQIVWDLVNERRAIMSNVEQVTNVVRRSAEQAAYEFSVTQADRVASGLFEYRAIQRVLLRADDGQVLVDKSRPAVETRWRELTELLFDKETPIRQKLIFGESKTPVGELEVTLDNAIAGEAFLERAVLVMASGLVRNMALAILMTAIFYGMVTRPLRAAAIGVAAVNPAHPREHLVPVPKGHDRNELGFLVKRINHLLGGFGEAIERRRLAEQMAQTSEKRLQAILDNVLDGIMTLDRDGRIQSANPAAAALFGIHETTLKGMSILNLLPELRRLLVDRSDLADLFDQIIAVHAGELGEVEGKTKTREHVTIDIGVSAHSFQEESLYIVILRDVTERKQAIAKIRHIALHDSLTDLANKNHFVEKLAESVISTRQYDQKLAVLLLDLDNFKEVNDTLGHIMGDHLLIDLAKRLQFCLKESDAFVARFGGDEFGLLVRNYGSPQDLNILTKKLLDSLAQPSQIEGHKLFITTSIGAAIFPEDGEDSAELLRSADLALYRAKQLGRNTIAYFASHMKSDALKRKTMIEELRLGIERNELEAWYQPIVALGQDLQDDEVVGVEALVRWRHPQRGLVRPDEFIPLAEASGLITAIGKWMLCESCQQVRAWQNLGLRSMTVAVNVAAAQFREEDLVPTILAQLTATNIDPKSLILELTESAAMQDMERTMETMRVLREHGIRFAIDDFGTGYSSLAYLQRFPAYKVKIDRAFIKNAPGDGGVIPRAVVTIGASLRLRVVAEGVENIEQLEFLRAIGCDEIQGYYFGKPMPAPEFTAWLGQFPQWKIAEHARVLGIGMAGVTELR